MQRTRSTWCVIIGISLLASACQSQKQGTIASPAAGTPRTGGSLVIGAEQEPDCADWIGTCSGSSWGYWILGTPTLPRAYDVTSQSRGTTYVPSPLLVGEPTLVAAPKQTVTYQLDPRAVWSDGQPITSHDFRYTWDQIANGKEIYDRTGYEQIENVDDRDPHVAVVTFKQPFAAWKDLFGAFYGVLPSHILDGKDRDALTKDGYTWSGGPWMMKSWTKGQDLTLVPNPRYWGTKPHLDQVTFKFLTDSSAEFSAYKTGQVMAIYPQPQIGQADQLKGLADTKSSVKAGLSYEGLWFNTAKAPLNEKSVRQALGYATDREAIDAQINRPLKSDDAVLQAFGSPNQHQFYTPAFRGYTRDLAKVAQLMTGAGWAKGADGIWTKDGKRATLEISTTAGNKARELVEQLLASQWKEAGFELKTNNTEAGTLFGDWLPKGNYMMGMYAQVPTPDPGMCLVFCAKNIPSSANQFSGQNWGRLASPTIDSFWDPADRELDVAARAQLVIKGQVAVADEVPAIPLFSKLTILVWNTRISGSLDDNYVLGPFWNLEEWSLQS